MDSVTVTYSRFISSAEIAEKIETIESQRRSLKSAADEAFEAFNIALAEHSLGIIDTVTLSKARKLRDQTKETLEESLTLLEGLKERHTSALEIERLAEVRLQKQRAAALNDARQKAFDKLQKSINAVTRDYAEVCELNDALFGSLPSVPDVFAAKLRIDCIDEAMRKALLKGGIQWAIKWPWGTFGIPDFIDEVSPSHGVISQWCAE